jgi:hypothetical protein
VRNASSVAGGHVRRNWDCHPCRKSSSASTPSPLNIRSRRHQLTLAIEPPATHVGDRVGAHLARLEAFACAVEPGQPAAGIAHMALASVVVLGSLDVREERPDVAAANEHSLSAEGFDDTRGRKPATEQVLLEAKLEFDPVPLRVPAVAAKDIALA